MRAPGAAAGFLRERVIRLHPLLFLGAIPGAVAMLVGHHPGDPYPWLTALSGPIPFPAFWKAELPRLPFPINGPSWSLFWELLVNIGFAFAMPFLTTRRLAIVTTIACGALAVTSHFIFVGDGNQIYAGLRVACFPLGVLLWRVHRSGRVPAWVASLAPWSMPMTLAVLLLPGPYSEVRELLAHFLLFPLAILASASYAPRFPGACRLAGNLSYPIYILHIPMLYVVELGVRTVAGPVSDLVLVAISLPLIYAVWRWYDEPLRAWLRRRWGWRKPGLP